MLGLLRRPSGATIAGIMASTAIRCRRLMEPLRAVGRLAVETPSRRRMTSEEIVSTNANFYGPAALPPGSFWR